jgi:hypothetical protein
MEVATKEAPMPSNLRRRQSANSSELVYGGLGHPKKTGNVHDRQDLASVDDVPFGWNIVDAETSLFIVKRLSALPIENLSHNRC